jgi:hypothetical protein
VALTLLRPWLVALSLLCLLRPWGISAAQEPTLDVVMARVAVYVAEYQKRVVGIVAEETYRQNVQNTSRGGRMTRQFRELKADLLLVQTPDGNRWLQFRDVFEVDRKPVRDRDERLYKLFVSPTRESRSQAQVIQDESSRYNIGPVLRTVNVPILGLLFFEAPYQPQLSIERVKGGNARRFDGLAPPDQIWRIGFKEVGSPTLIRGAKDGDLRTSGHIWVDSATGRILRTELVTEDLTLHSEIEVTYRVEPGINVLVPGEMRELYRVGANQTRIDGRATYTKFRQFTVTTTEKTEKPKP